MFSAFFRRTRVTVSIGLGIVTAFMMMLCSQIMVAPIASAASQVPMAKTAVVNLRHSPNGVANLTFDASAKTLTVRIGVVGLAPSSTHPAHIHLGSCASPNPGTIKYALQNVVANAKGQGFSMTVLHNITSPIPATGWYINVHNGPGLTPAAQYTPIACGNVANPKQATSVLTFLGASPNPNEEATGTAKLTVTNNVLTVVLNVSGLAPNSTHAAHIHAGNCFNTRQVLYDLSPLVADANGYATKTVTFAGVSSIPAVGWDINIHYTTDLSTQTGYNPILCGDVIPR
jgi:Cu/Zn superoxide dismutase